MALRNTINKCAKHRRPPVIPNYRLDAANEMTEAETDRPELSEECFAEKLDNALRQTNLLLQRDKDLSARDWYDFAKNYADGRLGVVLHCRVGSVAKDDSIRLLLLRQGLRPGRIHHDECCMAVTDTKFAPNGADAYVQKVLPVLIGIGDLVDGPKGIIPSGMWFLPNKQIPHLGRQFLFQSLFMTGVWERLWIACDFVYSPPGEADPGNSPIVFFDESNDHFVESVPELHGNLARLQRQFFGGIAGQARDVVNHPIVRLGSNFDAAFCNEGKLDGLQFDELCISAFDLCQ